MGQTSRRTSIGAPLWCDLAVAAALSLGWAGSAAAGLQAPAGPVTFARDVAPIIFSHCVTCHHPEGAAPFSLVTFATVRQHAGQIAVVTRSRFMPPWQSEPGYGEFIGHQMLSDGEIATIQQWVADGAPEGDSGTLPQPRWTEGWQLGQPDLVVTLPEPFVLPAEGPDVSRVFVIPVPISTMRDVRGLEFRPGNPKVVHHANIRLDPTRASRELDAADPAPGYDGLILRSAAYPDGHFLGWTPGQVAPLVPKGLEWRLAPNTDLVLEAHLQPSGKRELVQPSIGLFFGDAPPERTPAMLRLGRQNIDIAPGQTDFVTTDSFVFPVDVEVQAVQPHAHYRAREIRGTATLPDGTTKWLIFIRNWDFRWQHVYRYVTPIALPRGTTVSMRYTYDNSAENPRNPQRPPQRVRWGQWANDEMGDLWIQVLTRDDRDRQTLNAAFRPKAMAEEVIGYESMIRTAPSRVQLHDDVGVLYLELGRPGDAVVHFEASARLQPDSAAAHYNLATALTLSGRLGEAIEEYGRALQLRPDYARAHNNLGDVLLRRGQADEALRHFREALRIDPRYAEAHYNAGSVLRSQARWSDAIDHFRRAAELEPGLTPAVTSLAWLLATVVDAALRNPAEAVVLAERAVNSTGQRDGAALDVLAAAYAAAGRFDRAIETAEAALAVASDAPLADEVRRHRALFQRNEPLRSPSGAPGSTVR